MKIKLFVLTTLILFTTRSSLQWELSDCLKMTKISKIQKTLSLAYINGEQVKCEKDKGVFDKNGNSEDIIRLDNFHDICLKIKIYCKNGYEFNEIYELAGEGEEFVRKEINAFDWKNKQNLEKNLWEFMEKLKKASGV